MLGDDVLAEASTAYGGSSEPAPAKRGARRRADDRLAVPPDGVFSFADALNGPIDEKNGFVTGFGIVANEDGGVTTAPVIGGGICQVSTTLFQAITGRGRRSRSAGSIPTTCAPTAKPRKGCPASTRWSISSPIGQLT